MSDTAGGRESQDDRILPEEVADGTVPDADISSIQFVIRLDGILAAERTLASRRPPGHGDRVRT